MPLAEGIHEFLELCGSLDLEKHLVIVVGHLDVQVFCCPWIFRFATAARAAVV